MDQIATRQEKIDTEEEIDAVRGIDVSGQNGEAVIMSFSARSIEIVISADAVGRGFNYALELYSNSNADGDSGAASKTISMIWIAASTIFGIVSLTRGNF